MLVFASPMMRASALPRAALSRRAPSTPVHTRGFQRPQQSTRETWRSAVSSKTVLPKPTLIYS